MWNATEADCTESTPQDPNELLGSLLIVSQTSVKNLEEAQAKAGEYLEARDEAGGLFSAAARKARANYEFLLAPWESLQILLRMVRSWLGGRYSPPVPTLLGAIAVLIYLVEPFDLIPDGIPVLGLVDDAAVIATMARMNLTEISRFRTWETSLSRREDRN